MNSIAERFIGSVWRETLDHYITLNRKQLKKVIDDYIHYYNSLWPHQGIDLQSPKGLSWRICFFHRTGYVFYIERLYILLTFMDPDPDLPMDHGKYRIIRKPGTGPYLNIGIGSDNTVQYCIALGAAEPDRWSLRKDRRIE